MKGKGWFTGEQSHRGSLNERERRRRSVPPCRNALAGGKRELRRRLDAVAARQVEGWKILRRGVEGVLHAFGKELSGNPVKTIPVRLFR